MDGLAATWPRTTAIPGASRFGTASDLALFLWQRAMTGQLDVQGETSLLSRYFVLVPPL
jgi:hypothetical protein